MDNKWVKRFINMSLDVSKWSHDPSTKVGAVIIDEDRNVVSVGYNGFPRNILDSEERLNNRELKYALTVHAEANAISACARNGIATKNCTLICTHYPCTTCAGYIIQAGISTVIVKRPSQEFLDRWGVSNNIAFQMLSEANVNVIEEGIDQD